MDWEPQETPLLNQKGFGMEEQPSPPAASVIQNTQEELTFLKFSCFYRREAPPGRHPGSQHHGPWEDLRPCLPETLDLDPGASEAGSGSSKIEAMFGSTSPSSAGERNNLIPESRVLTLTQNT